MKKTLLIFLLLLFLGGKHSFSQQVYVDADEFHLSSPGCTDYPPGLDFQDQEDMIKRGFFVVMRTTGNPEYFMLDNVLNSKLHYHYNGRRYRAVYIAKPVI